MASTISANSAGGGGLVTSGDASGVLNLQTASVTALSIDASQKVTFTNSLTLPTLTSPIIAGTPTGVGVLTSGTAVASTSGTSIDFTGIPSWVKRITVMLNGISTTSTGVATIRLGTASGIDSTGYASIITFVSTASNSTSGQVSDVSGFELVASGLAISTLQGPIVLTNLSGNLWVMSGVVFYKTSANYSSQYAGSKTLAGVLTQVQLTTTGGTDTFDADSINIMYE